jgi:alpha-glucosidase (family GH31 glycosyl hydrolase)
LLQDFQVKKTGDNTYEITTSALKMVFEHDNFPFGLHNFNASYTMDGKTSKFTIRNIHKNNLGGAISTLDRVSEAIPLDDGLLSRDGWYIIDDAGKEILKDDWLSPRDRSHVQDLYCFVYGNNYKAALRDLGRISGHVPMTRKYVHGVWYCRYWSYTSKEYLQLVDEYKQNNFPLDIVVFDMDWHTMDAKVGTGHSGNRSWTGYTWNQKLIPDPTALIQTLLKDSIHVALNEHPHDGIRPNESMYADFMQAMGEKPDGKTLLFDAGNKKYMTNFLKYAHCPSWDMGVAFWWLDWQQNYLYSHVRGANTSHLTWLNKLYYEDSQRNGLRGAGYSRWAGWGDHRYPIQFSGDAHANWNMLAFEIELTATSGNAGCYYWAHDIGGFYGGADPELYIRWTQFGALSAALRVHSQKKADLDRRPWIWGEQATEATRKAYHFRSEILPYIYSSVWQTHETMIPLNRAMYIDYGADERAYHNAQQFMFGDLLLAAPITQAGEGMDKVAGQKVWFPEGEVWYDFFNGAAYKGGTETEIRKNIDEFPLFVKGGYVLPMQPYRTRPASSPLTELVMRAYPAAKNADNTYTLYEDDGITTDYANGKYAVTALNYKQSGNEVIITVAPVQGTYEGQPQKRSYTLQLAGIEKIKTIKVNKKTVQPVYDEALKMYIVHINPISIAMPVVIQAQVTCL